MEGKAPEAYYPLYTTLHIALSAHKTIAAIPTKGYGCNLVTES